MIIHFNSKYVKEKFQIYIAKSMEKCNHAKMCMYIYQCNSTSVFICMYKYILVYVRARTHTHTPRLLRWHKEEMKG